MKIFIMGAGHMGAWLTEELCHDHEVCVYDREPKKLKYFINVKRVVDLAEIKDFAPEMVINCVSLQHTEQAFKDILPYLNKSCILSDITSVKNNIQEFYQNSGHPFVSTHPMFGPTFANIRDLSNENAIIITESCEEGKKFFNDFYHGLGVNIYHYTFDEHDQTTAYSLSTPFASTMVFAACMKKQDAPGTTFKRHLSIAKGLLSEDDYLIAEIMFNKYTIAQVDKINQKLSYLSHILRDRDFEEMRKFLASIRENIN